MDSAQSRPSFLNSLNELLRPGRRAFLAYWKLFLAIQFLALIFVLSFYKFQGVRDLVASIRELQVWAGVWFAASSNIISGAIIPETVKLKFRAKVEKPITWSDFGFRCMLMATSGALVYYFYLLQDQIFGSGIDPLTLFKKILVDQLIFSPFLAVPFIVGMFILHENRHDLRAFRKNFSFDAYKTRVVTLWATGLSFWPVMLIVIYAMPVDMQFILFQFANTAWCLVMMLVASNQLEEK